MKKILSGILAASMVMSFAAMSAFAADTYTGVFGGIGGIWNAKDDEAWDSNDGDITNVDENAFNVEGLRPGSEIIIPIDNGAITWTNGPAGNVTNATTKEVSDKDYFKFDFDKDTNGKYITKIELVKDKKYDGNATGGRYDMAIKFTIGEYTGTSEIHTDGEISFTAKKTSKTGSLASGTTKLFNDGDEIVIPYSFWISNKEIGNDDNPDAGDRVYFKADKNDTNTLVWGEDRAALKFDSDNSADKFYARLETNTDRQLYAEYGDPVDAELWFYTFVQASTIPATSRATLTLGVPWDDDDDYTPDPETCFIYEKDVDGNLVDMTDKFTFSEDDEEIPGWSFKTRTLGTYVISDTELDIEAINADEEEDDEPETAPETSAPTTGGKDNPGTGSADMVNVAVVAAVVSLAAAGAVAFRKAK